MNPNEFTIGAPSGQERVLDFPEAAATPAYHWLISGRTFSAADCVAALKFDIKVPTTKINFLEWASCQDSHSGDFYSLLYQIQASLWRRKLNSRYPWLESHVYDQFAALRLFSV